MTETQNNIIMQQPLPFSKRIFWVIKNFSEYYNGSTLISPEFVFNTLEGVEEKLKFEITGRDSYTDYILILHFHSESSFQRQFAVNYSIINKTGEIIFNERRKLCIVGPDSDDPVRCQFIETEDLKELILKNNIIILLVDITDINIDKGLLNDLLKMDVDKKSVQSKVFKQFTDFYRMKNLCDFKITVGNKEFFVHKFALAARSPVFAALFINEANSDRCNSLEIADASAQVVEEMIHYIYTGTINNIELVAEDMLVIGDKYNLDGLVEVCTDHLKKKINASNVFHMIAFSTKYNVEALKIACHFFFIQNTRKILKSETFSNIINFLAYSFDS